MGSGTEVGGQQCCHPPPTRVPASLGLGVMGDPKSEQEEREPGACSPPAVSVWFWAHESQSALNSLLSLEPFMHRPVAFRALPQIHLSTNWKALHTVGLTLCSAQGCHKPAGLACAMRQHAWPDSPAWLSVPMLGSDPGFYNILAWWPEQPGRVSPLLT